MGDLILASENQDGSLEGISLAVRQTTPVRRLPGFSRLKHRIPEEQDRRAQEFVARLGSKLICDDLDAAFSGFRTIIGYRRRQLAVTESEEGFGTIQTPHFLYSNSVFQCDKDASQAIWLRELSHIVSPDVLQTEHCNQLFADVFDTIEFTPSTPISLGKLVDHIEDLENDQVVADYDRALTYCQLSIESLALSIQVRRDSFRVVHPQPVAPRELLHCIQDLRGSLVDYRNLS